MNFAQLVKKNRSCRRFDESRTISPETLYGLVDLARISASARNLQPLKYLVSYQEETNKIIFPHLAWAGYLESWDGPEEGQRPAAYILVFLDHHIAPSPDCDHGIAAQTMLLAAAEAGLGGCMIGSVRRKALTAALDVPDHLELLMAVALGVPAEQVVIEEIRPDEDVKYWRDSSGVHHVPKRSLEHILIQPGNKE